MSGQLGQESLHLLNKIQRIRLSWSMTAFREYTSHPLFRFLCTSGNLRLAGCHYHPFSTFTNMAKVCLYVFETEMHTHKKLHSFSGNLVMLLLVRESESKKGKNILNFWRTWTISSFICGSVCYQLYQIELDTSLAAALKWSVCDRCGTATVKASSNTSGTLTNTETGLSIKWRDTLV